MIIDLVGVCTTENGFGSSGPGEGLRMGVSADRLAVDVAGQPMKRSTM